MAFFTLYGCVSWILGLQLILLVVSPVAPLAVFMDRLGVVRHFHGLLLFLGQLFLAHRPLFFARHLPQFFVTLETALDGVSGF